MEAKKIAVFGGGSGAQSLLEGLKTNPENFITVIINAYDNGKSTGKVREDYHTLGPSDARKNLVHLLDDRNPDARHIREFFSLRLEDRDMRNAGKILRAIAENDTKTIGKCSAKWNVYSRLPLEFRDPVSLGMRNYLGEIRKNGKKPDYSDFSIMNAVFAGIMGKKGCLQKATYLISDAMPLRGKVLLNSLQNLHLYAVRKSGNHHYGVVQDEAAIVSQAVPGRIQELFLLESPLHPDETDSLTSISPEEIKEKLRPRSVSPCLNPKVRDALRDADIIIYAPGTPHSSLYPTYMTSGLADCIADNTRAVKIFLCNIREDKDICGYSAPELFNTALSYLRRSSAAHFSAPLLVDYVFVNTPPLLHRSYISADIEYFRRSPEFQVMAENEFLRNKERNRRGMIRVIHTDMEDAVNSGKHNSHKLMSFVSHIPGMSCPEIPKIRMILTRGAVIFDVDQTLLDVRIDPVAHQKYEESLLNSIHFLRHKPVLIIPAAGKGSRLNADVPKPLYPVAGKPAIVHVLDLFSDFTEQIIILINPSHRQAFEQVLKKREERIVLVDHDIQTGEGRAVRDALPHAGGDCRDVIVAWADLIKGNREKIQKTLEMHYESGSSMTFPTMWEPNPYVAILRDEQDRVCRAAFRQYGEIHLRGEHDCSFFVINRNRLEQAAAALHTQYFHSDAGTYDFRDFGIPEPYGTDFKFLYLLQYLYEEGRPAVALPICKRNEFLGFNTKEEAGQIEAEYEFVPAGSVAMRQAV